MNLVVDFGNTRIKAALFQNSVMQQARVYDNVTQLMNDHSFYGAAQNVIISSVVSDHRIFSNSLGKKNNVLLFDAGTAIPIKNLYKSASSLGSDRLAAAIGSFTLYPGQNVLTIDAGTCIKYNFVTAGNEYVGGAISAGLTMRLKALNAFTNRLPLLQPDFNYENLTGLNTNESMMSGALVGAVAEAEGMITRYETLYKNLIVVLTGGDASYLCKQLKNRIFAHPDLILIGLNTILNYNIEK